MTQSQTKPTRRVEVNPADYQSLVDGKPVKVSELSRHALEQELCHAMDLINDAEEAMFANAQAMNQKFNNWHRGR